MHPPSSVCVNVTKVTIFVPISSGRLNVRTVKVLAGMLTCWWWTTLRPPYWGCSEMCCIPICGCIILKILLLDHRRPVANIHKCCRKQKLKDCCSRLDHSPRINLGSAILQRFSGQGYDKVLILMSQNRYRVFMVQCSLFGGCLRCHGWRMDIMSEIKMLG